MDEQLFVIEILLVLILVVMLALLCVTAIFLQPVVINNDREDYESI